MEFGRILGLDSAREQKHIQVPDLQRTQLLRLVTERARPLTCNYQRHGGWPWREDLGLDARSIHWALGDRCGDSDHIAILPSVRYRLYSWRNRLDCGIRLLSDKADVIRLGKPESSQSLAYVNFKRAMNYGKVYLILGVAVSLGTLILLTVVPGGTTPQTSAYVLQVEQTLGIHNASVILVALTYPDLVPMSAIISSMGALMIFSSDKTKGVYEYLIAYGVNPSSIFWSILATTIGIVSIVLVVSVSSAVALLAALNGSVPHIFVQLTYSYIIPLSYAGAIFGCVAGMIWSSLSTRRAGINSPVGIAPLLGMLPVLAVLFVSETMSPSDLLILAGAVSACVVGGAALMIWVANNKMVRERFLSNA